MTHIENIPHILSYGIVHKSSWNKNPNYVTIGDQSLIDFRSSKEVNVVSGKKIVLGDYIPFYFGVRMPMLYVIQHGGNFVERARKATEIVYIAVSLEKLITNNFCFYFSDGHATDMLTTFYESKDAVRISEIIDWQAVKSTYWAGDEIETDLKRRKQAELLVKEDVPAEFIVGFVCYDTEAKMRLMKYGIKEKDIKIYPSAYYKP